jgi:hypothetical protein
MTKKKCFPIHLPSIHNVAWVTFGSLWSSSIHPFIHPSIHPSGHGVLVAVGSFWPCQWYIVLWPGGPSQQQHGQNLEKKKWVGLKDSPLSTVVNKDKNFGQE